MSFGFFDGVVLGAALGLATTGLMLKIVVRARIKRIKRRAAMTEKP